MSSWRAFFLFQYCVVVVQVAIWWFVWEQLHSRAPVHWWEHWTVGRELEGLLCPFLSTPATLGMPVPSDKPRIRAFLSSWTGCTHLLWTTFSFLIYLFVFPNLKSTRVSRSSMWRSSVRQRWHQGHRTFDNAVMFPTPMWHSLLNIGCSPHWHRAIPELQVHQTLS